MSFLLNQLNAFDGSPKEIIVDRTLGTNIGNGTLFGGLAACFDGNSNQAGAASAGTSGANIYIGKSFTVGKAISRANIAGTNNIGYANTGGATSITITLYGKNGSPANGTDGTSLGSITFAQSQNESTLREIISSDRWTTYTNFWCFCNGANNSMGVAEVIFYEMI